MCSIQPYDCLEFLPREPEDSPVVRFVWLSRSSGYKHLYVVESTPPPPVADDEVTVPFAQFTSRSVTQGNWSVLGTKVRGSVGGVVRVW